MVPPKKWGSYLPAVPLFANRVESGLTFHTEEEESGSDEEVGRIAPRAAVKKKWDDEESEEEEVYSPSYDTPPRVQV